MHISFDEAWFKESADSDNKIELVVFNRNWSESTNTGVGIGWNRPILAASISILVDSNITIAKLQQFNNIFLIL